MRADEVRDVDAKAPDLKEAHRPKKADTQKIDVRVSKYGNDRSYAHARLRRDRPDLHARVLSGELSPHAAMIEAGFRKKRPSQKKSRVDRALAMIEKMTAAAMTSDALALSAPISITSPTSSLRGSWPPARRSRRGQGGRGRRESTPSL